MFQQDRNRIQRIILGLMLIAWVFFYWYNNHVNIVWKGYLHQWGDSSSRLNAMGLGSFFVPKNIKKYNKFVVKYCKYYKNVV